MWHNLTNHPAHQANPSQSPGEENKTDGDAKKGSDEEPKKESGSGSG
jgi:hypothetical protein